MEGFLVLQKVESFDPAFLAFIGFVEAVGDQRHFPVVDEGVDLFLDQGCVFLRFGSRSVEFFEDGFGGDRGFLHFIFY